MAYVSIIDLPELYQNNIKGSEFLLVTNDSLESNKLQMDTLTNFMYDKIKQGIDSNIDEKLNNVITNSKITVYDEGIEVGATTKINFIGANVNSFINETNSVDVYIPSISVSSHFNTKDNSSDATVIPINTYKRFISRPNFDGAPFRIGDWTPGTLQNTINSPVNFVLNDKMYVDKNAYMIFKIIQNNNVVHSLNITFDEGTTRSTYITATVSNKHKELSHYNCNLSFTFDPGVDFKGRMTFYAEYFENNFSSSFSQEVFYDNNLIQASMSSSATFKTIFDKYLSGVKFIGPQSTIFINSILSNAKNLTSPQNICDFDGTQCGLSSYNINFGELGITNYYFDSDISFSKEYTILPNKFYNSTLKLKYRVNDWIITNFNEITFNGLVDTFSDNSTRIYEDFVSETYRYNSDFTTFDSTRVLDALSLQVYASKLVYPQLDFSNFYNNPNYSNYTGTKQYFRKFWHTNVSHSNGIFGITSNLTESDLNSVKIEISLDKVNWYNCCADYLGGVLTNGAGCRINTDVNSLNINNKIEFTLGLNKFTSSTSEWGVYTRVTFLENAKDKYIDVLQITNW